jgi:hypothetical protein
MVVLAPGVPVLLILFLLTMEWTEAHVLPRGYVPAPRTTHTTEELRPSRAVPRL